MDPPSYEPKSADDSTNPPAYESRTFSSDDIIINAPTKNFLKTPYSESHGINLTHPINPIFALEYWKKCKQRRYLEPILRLASLMLESPASQRFIHSLIFYNSHERRGYAEQQLPSNSYVCRFPKSNASAEDVERDVQEASLRLAKIVSFRWRDDDGISDGHGHNLADWGSLPAGRTSTRLLYWRWGTRINIIMRYEPFKVLIDAEPLRREGITVEGATTEALARTLCQQVIQGFNFLPGGDCDHFTIRHYYGDQHGPDVGLVWEKEVFGSCWIGGYPFEPFQDIGAPHWMVATGDYEEVVVESDMTTFGIMKHSIVDFVAWIQQQEFWDTERRSETMLRIPSMSFEEARTVHGVICGQVQ
ncbi:MAG: hypothetical protein Q9181_006869 [Wetmoreana brouardii]